MDVDVVVHVLVDGCLNNPAYARLGFFLTLTPVAANCVVGKNNRFRPSNMVGIDPSDWDIPAPVKYLHSLSDCYRRNWRFYPIAAIPYPAHF